MLCFWVAIGAIMLRRHSLRSLLQWRQSHSAFHTDHRCRRRSVGDAAAGGRLAASALCRGGRCPSAHVLAGGTVIAATDAGMGRQIRRLGERCRRRRHAGRRMARIAIKKLPPEQQRLYLNSDGSTKRTALEKFQPHRLLRHSAERSSLCPLHLFCRQAAGPSPVGGVVFSAAFLPACRFGTLCCPARRCCSWFGLSCRALKRAPRCSQQPA